jgi:hypothetical protein
MLKNIQNHQIFMVLKKQNSVSTSSLRELVKKIQDTYLNNLICHIFFFAPKNKLRMLLVLVY